MSLQKFLSIASNGRTTQTSPLTASAGASSAGAIIALNSAGTLDPTMLPTGVGADVQMLPATETIASGAYVNIWSNSGVFSVRNADGSMPGKECSGFVLSGGASGASLTVYLSGINTAVTGQVPGFVYLSDTSPGTASATPPTTVGHVLQQIGVALSASSVQFNPQSPVYL